MTKSNPYVGPRAFSKSETLYGRDRELRILTDRLIAERIVLLHSPSGAGKTSLVQAGLIPELLAEGFFVHPVIRVNAEIPADLHASRDSFSGAEPRRVNRYVFSTLLSLEERYPPAQRTKLNRLARLSLGDYLALRSLEDQREGPEFLIFDQFEEVLSIDPNDRAAKNSFFSQLRTILRNRNRWALFSMRTDYVGALEPYTRNIPTYFSNTFHLEFLGVKAALEAIRRPAIQSGVDFAEAAAQKLVDDLRRVQVQSPDGSVQTQLGLYVEPVQLQVVCYRLWENHRDDAVIDEQDLAKVGDVNRSLADYYAMSVARVAAETGVEERDIREWFDRSLITPESTRSLVRAGAETSAGLPNRAVQALEASHLVRTEKRAGQTWYELSHDRMIEPVRVNNREWFETHLNLFQHQAHLWNEQGRSDGLLLRGDALQMAEQQAAQIALNANEKAFLEACRAQRQREQRDIYQRRLIAAGFVVSLFLFFVAVFFSISASMANRTSQIEAMNAQAASTQAFLQFSTAQAANTLAFSQQATAQAASTLAIAQSDNVRFASSQAIANAEAAAAARQQAEAEKREAEAQRRAARANELAVQSILARNNKQSSIASLLAVEAFQMIDSPRTRIQLLSAVGASGLLVGVANNTGATSTLAFDPAGQAFFSNNFYICPADSQYFVCRQGVFRRWALTPLSGPHARGLFQMSLVYTFSSPGDMLDSIALRLDASQIASVFCTPTQNNIVRCEKLKLQMWDASTDERLGAEILLAENAYNSRKVLLAYSPDASRLAVAFNDETLVIFDAQTYQEQARFDLNNGISQFAFSPDSRLLAFTSGLDTTLTLIDLPGQERREVNIPAETRALVSLAYAPDGKSLVLGSRDGQILFWDVASQSLTGQVYGRQGQVLSLAFSPDGKILASGHETYHLILWDVPSRQTLLRPIFRHTDAVRSLAFSQDGTKLLSAGREIILWNMSTDFWVEKVCAQAGRNFSLQEWQQYFPGEAYRITCSQWPPRK